MGASQSKKRRKEKRRRRHHSTPNLHEITRSASVDVIRTMSVAPQSSLSTSCSHCQLQHTHSLSWSEAVDIFGCNQSAHHHQPNHHNHLDDRRPQHRSLHGQYEDMRVGIGACSDEDVSAGFESCPNCYSNSTTTGQLQLPREHDAEHGQHRKWTSTSSSEIRNRNDRSTMSLNRNFMQRVSVPAAGTIPMDNSFPHSGIRNVTNDYNDDDDVNYDYNDNNDSQELQEYSQFSEAEGIERQIMKHRISTEGDAVCSSQNQRVSHHRPYPLHHTIVPNTTTSTTTTSTKTTNCNINTNNNNNFSPLPKSTAVQLQSSQPPGLPSSSPFHFQPIVADPNPIQHHDGSVRNSQKISLLDDDETKVSRWVKRKQMAQRLRDLRKHLGQCEDSAPPNLSPCGGHEHYDNHRADVNSCSSSNRPGGDQSRLKVDNVSDMPNNFSSPPAMDVDASPLSCPLSSSPSTVSPVSPSRRSVRSKFSRMSNYRCLDNHPVLTRLQNEQNNRIESMERRMKEIRISAMQEAQRRKFAEIFPAKNDDSETQRMLREAKETLEKLKEEKKRKAQAQMLEGHQTHQGQHLQEQTSQTSSPENTHTLSFRDITSERDNAFSIQSPHDAGEIIPVCVVPRMESKSALAKLRRVVDQRRDAKGETNKADAKPYWPKINLNQPLTWLVLPFLLFPLILRMVLSLVVNSGSSASSERLAGSNNGRGEDGGIGNARRSSHEGHSSLSPRLGSKE